MEVHRSVHCIQFRCFIAKETTNLLKNTGNWYLHDHLNKAAKVNECEVSKSRNVICTKSTKYQIIVVSVAMVR